MRTNYVMVNFENVRPEYYGLLDHDHFKTIIFIGVTQNKVRLSMASCLQPMGEKIRYVQLSASGPNALDFHIAFYIGKLSAMDNEALFHIISKDTGYDPLITHLKSEGILVTRSDDIDKIPQTKFRGGKTLKDRIDMVVSALRATEEAKPRTKQKLSSMINNLFLNQLTGVEIELVINGLTDRGFVCVTDNKVAYTL